MLEKGKRISNKRDMKSGPQTAEDNHPDFRMAENNNAYDKRWRNGNVKREPKAEAQRKADQEGIYIPS